jgi:holliday junction DNA helicase RuvA
VIASLRGKVIFRGINRLVLEAQGVGYDVAVTLATAESLPPDGEVFLHVHTAMRENALELYGFMTPEEKALFELLLTVAGVGPRTSLMVLSGISPEGFQQAVLDRDIRQLTAIPGIGKKSAERIILELREKIEKLSMKDGYSLTKAAGPSLHQDLISSLINLGYTPRSAEAAARQVLGAGGPDVTLSEAVRMALKDLVK